MAIYQGVNGVNREIKQIFQGIGGVNREIKERWEGVSGVNRQVFSGEPTFPILYDKGKENTSVTGGWETVDNSNYKITKEQGYLYLQFLGSEALFDMFMSHNNMLSVNGYTKLNVDAEFSGRSSNAHFGISLVTAKNQKDNTIRSKLSIRSSGVYALDISGVTQNVFISFNMYCGYLKIKKIWLS